MYRPGLLTTTQPTEEPLTLAEVQAYLRLESGDDDDLLNALIKTARRFIENYTGRTLITTGYTLWLDTFGKHSRNEPWWDGMREGALSATFYCEAQAIPLPRGPNVAVTALSTFAEDDTESVFAATNYRVNDAAETAEIVLKESSSWPTSLRNTKAIKIVFTAGYGATGDSVPAEILTAMKTLIAYWYENRGDCACSDNPETEVPMSVSLLLRPYRVVEL